jgi:ribosomal subunit interface protein
MVYKFNYRKIDPSESLEAYILNHLEGVARFLLKEGRWNIEISKVKGQPQVHFKVKSPWGFFSAQALGDDYYLATDRATTKLITQVKKRKSQLQYHKKPEKSRSGQLNCLNESLEYFPDPKREQTKAG